MSKSYTLYDKPIQPQRTQHVEGIDALDSTPADQTAKADAGKLQLTLVPPEIIEDIAEVRMYGNKKYHDPDNWKQVKVERYRDALFRHFLAYLRDPNSIDSESGIPHYKHVACNMSFICAMERKHHERLPTN